MLPALVTAASCLLATAAAVPTHGKSHIETVFEFPNNSFVENLAVRPNGQILVTVLTSRELVLVDPQRPGHSVLVHNFTDANGLTGITEYEPDVFAVATGDYHFKTPNWGQGTWALWSVDLRGVKVQNGALVPPPKVSKIVHVPESQLFNGIALLSKKDKTLLVADTKAGVIYRVNAKTGDYKVVINSTETSPLQTPHGVNGVRIYGDTLYFSNSGQFEIFKVRLHEDGTPAGPFVVAAKAKTEIDEYDDFAVDHDGNIFTSTGSGNSILKVSANGKHQTIVAGSLNSTDVAEPTSAVFGRGPLDKSTLYVTTAGGSAVPVNGNIIIPGKLLAIKTHSRA
ncbi:2-succinylbenzoate-CoA ligase [Purpureocillium lavendulum]|uniref:2-succinylbenzoate-CoA ligase n=1 Tax=Purpureocillium lavendulum TaxID=1247861 RepID=A0AB34FV25_9HYPO|nr:2-succinylbenzoate-CoA ligase [Purpureocillium lavendulum]